VMSKVYQIDDQHERVYLTDSENYESEPEQIGSNQSLQIDHQQEYDEPPRQQNHNQVESSKEAGFEGGNENGEKAIHPCKQFHKENENIISNIQDIAQDDRNKFKISETISRLRTIAFSRKNFRYGH
jgi:hypothetical protein